MPPQQTVQPQTDYDFILNPNKPAKQPLGGKWIKDPFIMKLIVLIGGAGIFIVVAMVVVNLLFSSKTNINDLVILTQSQQEIVRLSAEGEDAASQQVKNAAINTALSVKSQQQSWFIFLKKYNRVVTPEELVLKKNLKTDQQLAAAKKASTYDTTYTAIMRSQLESYAALLRAEYKKATNKTEKALINDHHQQVFLLLKQWPQ